MNKEQARKEIVEIIGKVRCIAAHDEAQIRLLSQGKLFEL